MVVEVELVEGRELLELMSKPRPWLAPVSGHAASQLANAAVIEIRRAAERTLPHPPLDTRKGLRAMRARQVGPSRAIVTIPPHMHFIDQGRRPGKMPPPRALRPWLRRRQAEGRLRGVTAFQLARSIELRGIRRRRFVERGLRYLQTQDRQRELAPIIADAITREWRIRGA